MFKAYTDGAVRSGNPGLCSCAFVLFKGEEVAHSDGFLLGKGTNNFAEYMGLTRLLLYLSENNITGCVIHSDSELMVKQVKGEYRVGQNLKGLNATCVYLMTKTRSSISWVRGHDGNIGNEMADAICNETLDKAQGKTA